MPRTLDGQNVNTRKQMATNRKHKQADRDLLLTNKHGGIVHVLANFEPGMVAKMKCGVVLVQWRDADRTGRKCKRCAEPANAKLTP